MQCWWDGQPINLDCPLILSCGSGLLVSVVAQCACWSRVGALLGISPELVSELRQPVLVLRRTMKGAACCSRRGVCSCVSSFRALLAAPPSAQR